MAWLLDLLDQDSCLERGVTHSYQFYCSECAVTSIVVFHSMLLLCFIHMEVSVSIG